MFLEFSDWPPSVVDLCMATPVFSLPVAYYRDGETIRLSAEGALDIASDFLLFPKLGPKSWRDDGRLRPVLLDGRDNEQVVASLLCALSPQQCYTTRNIVENDAPLFLYLFPWIDFTTISEFRFLYLKRTGTARLLSQVNRTTNRLVDKAQTMTRCAALSKKVGAAFDRDGIVVDVGLRPTGDVRLIEVNPARTRGWD